MSRGGLGAGGARGEGRARSWAVPYHGFHRHGCRRSRRPSKGSRAGSRSPLAGHVSMRVSTIAAPSRQTGARGGGWSGPRSLRRSRLGVRGTGEGESPSDEGTTLPVWRSPVMLQQREPACFQPRDSLRLGRKDGLGLQSSPGLEMEQGSASSGRTAMRRTSRSSTTTEGSTSSRITTSRSRRTRWASVSSGSWSS